MDTDTPATQLYRDFCQALRDRAAAAGGDFYAPIRDLAEELGCSAGAIPAMMRRAEDEGRIIRRKHRNTHRIRLIDQLIDQSRQPRQAWAPPLIDQLIDQPAEDAPAAAPIAVAEATPQPDAESALIDQIPPHKVHDIKQEEGEVGAPPVVMADTSFAHLGVHPAKERELHAAGVTPGRLRQLIARKAAEGARSPLGAAIAAACAGLTAGDWRQEERSTDGPPHAPAGRPPAHQPARPGGRRGAAAGPSATFADPAAYYELLPGGT